MSYYLWHWGFGKYRADENNSEAYTTTFKNAQQYDSREQASDDRISEDETVLAGDAMVSIGDVQ